MHLVVNTVRHVHTPAFAVIDNLVESAVSWQDMRRSKILIALGEGRCSEGSGDGDVSPSRHAGRRSDANAVYRKRKLVGGNWP